MIAALIIVLAQSSQPGAASKAQKSYEIRPARRLGLHTRVATLALS
jgi:hypothetical protein